jgi:hypothetical protein
MTDARPATCSLSRLGFAADGGVEPDLFGELLAALYTPLGFVNFRGASI